MNRKNTEKILTKLENEKRIPLIEVHQITSVAPSLLNRDFNNRIKTCFIGGTSRVYLSSQSQRRPIRLREYKDGAKRTKDLPILVAEVLRKEPYNKDEEYCLNVMQYITKKIGEIETGQILAFSDADVQRIAKEFAENVTDVKDLKPVKTKGKNSEKEKLSIPTLTDLNKQLENSANDAKIDDTTALMGRMSTDSRLLKTVVSALHMNHAYSTDEWMGDSNCFVAVDDYKKTPGASEVLNKPEYINFLIGENSDKSSVDTSGSAMMDDSDLASNTFYRYASISMRTLIENKLSGISDDASEEEIENVIKESVDIATRFIDDYTSIVPSSKQTENATAPTPLAVFITVGTRVYPSTADSYFEQVIRATDTESVGEQSVKRLSKYADDGVSGAFARNEYQKEFWISALYKDNTPECCENVSLKDALNQITDLIVR